MLQRKSLVCFGEQAGGLTETGGQRRPFKERGFKESAVQGGGEEHSGRKYQIQKA